jgi:signal transduction histidine kinase
MTRRSTLTQRVVWAVTGAVALLTGLLAALAYVTVDSQEDELTDEMLRGEVQQMIALALKPGLMPVGALEASPRVTAYLTRDGMGVQELPSSLRGLNPGLYQLSPDGHQWHVAVVDTDDGRMSVVLDATASEARVHRFGYTVLTLWLVCLGIAALVARAVAAIAVGPIVEATRNIARLAPERSGPDADLTDEASVLMETFNRFRDRVDETVAREREFAANLDHEIRTPLTAIRTDAELTTLEIELPPAQRLRMKRIMISVDEIIATARSALSSSEGAVMAVEEVELQELLASVCTGLSDRAAARGLRVEIAIEAPQVVVLASQALLVVCRNIVRNAIDHATPGSLTIEGDIHSLVFRDDGPGIAPASLPHVFERYHRGHRLDDGAPEAGSPRRGLGLAIARRLCDLQGWGLRAESPLIDGRGTAFIVDLSPSS